MDETLCRKIVAESRLAACALAAAGDVLKPLMYLYREYADAVQEIAALADQAEGARLQQLARQLQAMFHVVNEALVTQVEKAEQAHAERLAISVEEVHTTRLYPPLPGDDADDATRAVWERSIPGQGDRWRRLGAADLRQERGHVFFELVRAVWLLAPSRSEIDAFLQRLDELAAEPARRAPR
ncbi:hypothetical protein AB0K18_42675 [Nonomuraea sp. NPDC049421]|uniref:hypothetical protein n=1 Tax=Nonomuraea sp. NPDC049421 TaxID=3155275 RepID=UPI003436FB52